METRADKIRRLQRQIEAEEARKAIFKKYGSYNAARQVQVHINNLKSEVEYEKQIELKEIDRPVIVQPAKKSWQGSRPGYILIGVIIFVIGSIIFYFILNSGLFK
jgi:hypothetical protein